MTVKEVSELTGRTEQTVRKWISEGLLKAEKNDYIRPSLKIDEKDLIKFCKENEIAFVKKGPDIPDHPPQRITQ